MNNFKKLLLVSVAALGGLGLVACEPGTPGESGTSQSPVATASRINSTLGTTPFAVGTQVDLDEYITVVYTDNKEDKNFTVQCISANASDLTIDGHVVTTAVAGTYTVEVRSGDNARTMRVPLDFRTEEVMEVIDFLMPITTHTQNFTIDLFETEDLTRFSYWNSVVHRETYGASYNKNNPGPEDFLIAQLADGRFYQGSFDNQGKPTFQPGYLSNPTNYFIMMPSSINPLAFNTVVDEESGETYLTGDASVSEALFWAASMPIDQMELTFVSYGDTQVVGFVDQEGDGEAETLLLIPSVNLRQDDPLTGEQTVQTIFYSNVIVGVRSIGSSSVEAIEKAQADSSFVPEVIEATELQTAFEALATSDNYTVTMDLYPATSSGERIYEAADTHYMNVGFGTHQPIYQRNKVTSEGVLGEVGFISEAQGGEAVHEEPVLDVGYFNRGGQGYQFRVGIQPVESTDEFAPETYNEVTALEGVSDVMTTAEAKAQTAAGVTGFGELNITSRTEDGTKVSFVSAVGDDDGVTKTNTLFQTLFNQFTIYGLGDEWAETSDGFQEPHALSLYSDYTELTVDMESGEIYIEALVYLPFKDVEPEDSYLLVTYTVTDIGTTTADFSGYTPSVVA